MAEFTKYTSGFNIGNENIGIEAAKVGWGALTALTADSTSIATSGIMTPDQIQLAIATKCGELTSFEIVTSTADMKKTNVIYLLKNGDTKTDNYEEYIVIDGNPTLIGETSIDLRPYATVSAMTAADQEIKNSLTAYPTKDEISGTDGILKNYATTADLNTVSGNLDAVSGDVDALKTASGDYVTSAFGKVVVTNGTTTQTYTAKAKDDTIKFIAGDNITLGVGADSDGNPTITINGDVQETILPEITGFNGISAEAVKEGDKITGYNVSGVEATTAAYGVTKASYYDDSDKLIHLF